MKFIQRIANFLSSPEVEIIWKYLAVIALPILGYSLKYIIDKLGVKHKLWISYKFEQKKSINEQYSKYITPLLKDAEELNHRLRNLKNNIKKKWNQVPENDWNNESRYYLRSFTYRLLSFWHYLIKAEMSVYSFDSKVSSRNQKKYFLFIKTLKYFFSERMLLAGMGYGDADTHNFYKDYLKCYTKYIINDDGDVCDFCEFENRMKKSYDQIKKVLEYIVNIGDEDENYNYTIFRCFHIFLIKFLNEFGYYYQKTERKKYKELIYSYKDLKNKEELIKFFERNKVLKYLKNEMIWLGVPVYRIQEIIEIENRGN